VLFWPAKVGTLAISEVKNDSIYLELFDYVTFAINLQFWKIVQSLSSKIWVFVTIREVATYLCTTDLLFFSNLARI
jgi:hypothetical protein